MLLHTRQTIRHIQCHPESFYNVEKNPFLGISRPNSRGTRIILYHLGSDCAADVGSMEYHLQSNQMSNVEIESRFQKKEIHCKCKRNMLMVSCSRYKNMVLVHSGQTFIENSLYNAMFLWCGNSLQVFSFTDVAKPEYSN